jgi:hypothetical protein
VRPDPREELIHMLTGLRDLGLREQVNLYRALQFPVSAYVMVPRVLSALGVEIESGEAS